MIAEVVIRKTRPDAFPRTLYVVWYRIGMGCWAPVSFHATASAARWRADEVQFTLNNLCGDMDLAAQDIEDWQRAFKAIIATMPHILETAAALDRQGQAA